MKGTVGELGEFGLIRELTSRLTTTPAVRLGPGDDAAVVAAPDRRVVASTDVLLEGRHFRRDWSTAYDVGRKAAAQNLADIAAMGATPTALLLGLVVPAELPATWPLELMDGISDECQVAGAAVAGGDVVRGDAITVAITALGDLQGRRPVTRSGARPGDVVAVTGWLGWSAAGYALLSRGFRSPRAFVEAHRRPEPPYAEGPAAAALGATAMTDVSDGLLADLGHIAEASGVSIDVKRAALDVPAQMTDIGQAVGVDPVDWVLTGGEDHAIVAAFPAKAKLPARWRVIGEVLGAGAGPQVTVDGAVWEAAGGWDHFGAPAG
ncbi:MULTISPECIES: thiamine-phosphate kinase [Streptomycetaceae]|uniref:Thiamine-monophosphate kinase n=1 Tax=Streptantibioticus cattleyicolor (strain ATCC 35852 / DSM 46488 / JCM 4925 / NBRC 14057 / NRRL 8057) TaxID=1003195 RepID=F8JQM2_STREN|nr:MULTISPECIES: thiamine-phosphate kinase [Streptomycetaceae]AEW96756.1 thiamine monophosphate kinase [Streptantibioticus cattleyicolor NRRL 8057 = DSM 46488]MYS61243.1 thiamine-phosphate kinase [Streptomyces sp. SID5468]CCB77093.1 putative thiamine monophosphate kinase [Streptantibioticus cattleyicolor NRRL 8057 = DSM 46488]